MPMVKIAVLDDYHGLAATMADWAPPIDDVTVFADTITGPGLVERLRPFDVICLMRERTPLPADLIDALPNLKLIVTTGMRNASVDMAAAKARGIPVCGTASRGAATSQLAMTLILAAMRGLYVEAASMRAGGWQAAVGRDLDGLTLGLIGLGKQGEAVAKLARPFGMKLIAWSANLTDARCAEVGVTRAESLGALLAEADVASVHVMLSERTRGLIGAAELAGMKPDSLVVNTSRGPIVDSAALLAALHAGRPGMAALDVYDDEPLPANHSMRDKGLIDAGRLLLTPHIGYGSKQTYQGMYAQTSECVRAWVEGAPVRVLG